MYRTVRETGASKSKPQFRLTHATDTANIDRSQTTRVHSIEVKNGVEILSFCFLKAFLVCVPVAQLKAHFQSISFVHIPDSRQGQNACCDLFKHSALSEFRPFFLFVLALLLLLCLFPCTLLYCFAIRHYRLVRVSRYGDNIRNLIYMFVAVQGFF